MKVYIVYKRPYTDMPDEEIDSVWQNLINANRYIKQKNTDVIKCIDVSKRYVGGNWHEFMNTNPYYKKIYTTKD